MCDRPAVTLSHSLSSVSWPLAISPLQACASGIRSRVDATEFASLYLKDVPVLQWAAQATEENYRRLRQYEGCHGWGGLDYHSRSQHNTANFFLYDVLQVICVSTVL